ncbi:MAG: hypothetical protein NUV73_01325 [Candidatus Daviesbacteria bacterium]|nr:hypothetical protein [Candidatus Daviesbacteria bacterium]
MINQKGFALGLILIGVLMLALVLGLVYLKPQKLFNQAQITDNLPLSDTRSSSEFSTMQIFYMTSEDGSLYKYDLNTLQLQKLVDGAPDLYMVSPDKSIWFIKNNNLFKKETGANVEVILNSLEQPVFSSGDFVVSPGSEYVVYSTIGKRFGAGGISNYWLVNTKIKETVAIKDSNNPSFYVTAPRWYNSHLVFQSQGAYATGSDLWEYIPEKGQFTKYNPFQLNENDWLNFSGLYSPDKNWVVYGIFSNNGKSTEVLIRNIAANKTFPIPKAFLGSSQFSVDSLFLGGTEFNNLKDADGYYYSSGADLFLYDINQKAVTKKVHITFDAPQYTGLNLDLLEVNSTGFVYRLRSNNSDNYTVTDTISSKSFTFSSEPFYIGRFNGNIYMQVDGKINILNTISGDTTFLSGISSNISKSFVVN